MSKTTIMIGLILIVLGIILNIARRNETLRNFLETTLLGESGIFEPNRSYSSIVRWLGWESIATGVVIMLPTHLLVNLGVAAFLVMMFFWAYFRFNKYLKAEEESVAKEAEVSISNEDKKE